MTASTEQERAEFEAAYVAEKLRIMGSEGSADGEKAIRRIMLRRNANGDYDNSLEAHFAWWAWQASRSAKSEQIQEGWMFVPVTPTQEMIDAACNDGVDLNGRPAWKHSHDVQATWRWQRMLAAAPQPPEANSVELHQIKNAAPVQMPEPEATVHSKIGTTCMFPSSNMRKGDKIYTEHQVRQLLADHNIK